MIGTHDGQRGKVYAWEERFVAPYDPSTIVLAQAQGMVDAIWTEMGLCFPPKVEHCRARPALRWPTPIASRYDCRINARPGGHSMSWLIR